MSDEILDDKKSIELQAELTAQVCPRCGQVAKRVKVEVGANVAMPKVFCYRCGITFSASVKVEF